MFDVEKQIAYWKDGALNDIESAEILIEKKKYLHGLFFCHLVIENALKAHYVKANNKVAPKSHDLFYLNKNTQLILNPEEENLLSSLMQFQIEGRYPEYHPKTPTDAKTRELLEQTKRLMKWLTKIL